MFDQILEAVKEHLGNNPQISSAIPADQQDAVHREIATHVTNAVQNQAAATGSGGGLLSMLEGAMASGSPVVSAIEGGLVGSLGRKFGLSPTVTGAIAATLPGLLQKVARKATTANTQATPTDVTNQAQPNSQASTVGNVLGKL